jgi:hypothetical protein
MLPEIWNSTALFEVLTASPFCPDEDVDGVLQSARFQMFNEY